MRRRLLALLMLTLALVLGAFDARANEPVRVVVRELEGDGSPSVKNALVRMLLAQPGVELVSSAHFEKIVERFGLSREPAKGVKSAARALGVAVVIDGSVDQDESGVGVSLRLRGSDGETLDTPELTAGSRRELARLVGEVGWKRLGPSISDALPAPASKKQRLVLLELSGPGSPQIRAALEAALAKSGNVELVPESEAAAARPAEAPKTEDRVLVAAALGATALLRGKITANQLSLTVLSGKSSDDVGEVKLKGFGVAGLKRAINKDLLEQLGPILADAAAPTPPREELEEEVLEAEPAAKEKPARRPSPLEAMLALRASTRNYRYSDDLFGALRAYKMGLTPAAFVAARWYPAAHFEGGFVAHLGLAGSFEQAFLIESRVGDESYGTTSREWQLGLHGRIPLGAVELGADLGLGEHSFAVDDDPNLPLVPDVAYRFIRAGLEGRYRAGNYSAGASFGYRHVTDAGTVATRAWFPRLDVAGLDVGAHAGYQVLPRLDVLVGALYRRYWYSMNPEPGDRFVAGGALDSYISGWVGVGYQLPAD